jgi:hypothetical protein
VFFVYTPRQTHEIGRMGGGITDQFKNKLFISQDGVLMFCQSLPTVREAVCEHSIKDNAMVNG